MQKIWKGYESSSINGFSGMEAINRPEYVDVGSDWWSTSRVLVKEGKDNENNCIEEKWVRISLRGPSTRSCLLQRRRYWGWIYQSRRKKAKTTDNSTCCCCFDV